MEYAPDSPEPTQHFEPTSHEQKQQQQQPSPVTNVLMLPASSPPSAAKSPAQTPQKDPAFAAQFAEKIRQQAKLLEELERYKIICEKRILELCPAHPLPVQPAHLGKVSQQQSPAVSEMWKRLTQTEEELHYSKQRNEKLTLELEQIKAAGPVRRRAVTTVVSPSKPEVELSEREYKENCESLISRVTQLQKEKFSLEESLRAEVLANEEQRNYAKILKEALETRIEDLGFSEILNQARTGKPNAQPVDIFAELAAVKKGADQSRREQAKYEGVARGLEGQMAAAKQKAVELQRENEDLRARMSSVQQELNDAVKSLEQTKQRAAKLEEEKASLLDFVEESNQKHDQLSASLESLNTMYKKVSEEKLAADKHVEQLEKSAREADAAHTQELAKRDTELSDLKSNCEAKGRALFAAERASLFQSNSDLSSKLQVLTKENESLTANQKNLKENYDALNNTFYELQTEAEQLRKQVQDLSQTKTALQRTTTDLEKQREEVRRLRDEVGRLASETAVHKREVQIKAEELRIYTAERDQYRMEAERRAVSEAKLGEELAGIAAARREAEQTATNLQAKLAENREKSEFVAKENTTLRERLAKSEETRQNFEQLSRKSADLSAESFKGVLRGIAQFAAELDSTPALKATLSKRFRDALISRYSRVPVDSERANELGQRVADCIKHLTEELEACHREDNRE